MSTSGTGRYKAQAYSYVAKKKESDAGLHFLSYFKLQPFNKTSGAEGAQPCPKCNKEHIKKCLVDFQLEDLQKLWENVKNERRSKEIEKTVSKKTYSKTHVLFRTDGLISNKYLITNIRPPEESEESKKNTFFTYGGGKYIVSGTVQAMRSEKAALPTSIKEALEAFKSDNTPVNTVIMFYGPSGSGKTLLREKCEKILKKAKISLTTIELFRREYEQENANTINDNNIKKSIKTIIEQMKQYGNPFTIKVKNSDTTPTYLIPRKINESGKQNYFESRSDWKDQQKILSTPLNPNGSSREHTLLTYQKEDKKLYLLDLAGSEKYDNDDLIKFFEKKGGTKHKENLRTLLPQAQFKIAGLSANSFLPLYKYDVQQDGDYIEKSLQDITRVWSNYQNTRTEEGGQTVEAKTNIGKRLKEILASIQNKNSGSTHLVVSIPKANNKIKNLDEAILHSIEFAQECSGLASQESFPAISS